MALLHGAVVAHVQIDGVNGGCAALQRARGHLGQFSGASRSQQQPRPSAAKASAVAAPMPALAPVMKTIFPFRLMALS